MALTSAESKSFPNFCFV